MATQTDKQTIGRHLEQVPKASNLISWSRNGFIAYIPPLSRLLPPPQQQQQIITKVIYY